MQSDCVLLTNGQKLKRVLRWTVICNGANRREKQEPIGVKRKTLFSALYSHFDSRTSRVADLRHGNAISTGSIALFHIQPDCDQPTVP